MKLLITNVVYGEVYSEIFLNLHLRSFLDQSNIPACRDRVEYRVFTDRETAPRLAQHENFRRLTELIPTEMLQLDWGSAPVDRFGSRYGILTSAFKESVRTALERKMLLSAIVADLVAARGFLPKVLAHIDGGFDSVFMMPPRAAYEAMAPVLLQRPGALAADELWQLCYAKMHPLWVASHWEASQFTKMPFHLLWNSGSGILGRSFAISPIIFRPNPAMLDTPGMIDGDVPGLCSNPYWAEDWTESPILNVEPLFCYYPPFANHQATFQMVGAWARTNLLKTQHQFVQQKFFYPDRMQARFTADQIAGSDRVISEICTGLLGGEKHNEYSPLLRSR